MKTTFGRSAALLAGLAVVAGCDSAVEPGPTLEGRVTLLDERARPLASMGPVTVRVLRPGGDRIAETTTDGDGTFAVEVVSTEPVTLDVSREGFGTTRVFDVTPGRDRVDVEVFALSSAVVASVDAAARPCGAARCLRLAAEVDNFLGDATTRRVFRVFMSRDPAVGPENYVVTESLFVPNDQPSLRVIESGRVRFELDESFGPLSAFPSGSIVYMRLHGATENLSSSYWDPVRGLTVYPDISDAWAGTSLTVP